MAEPIELNLPEGAVVPAGALRILDARVPCATCGEPVGPVAEAVVEQAETWTRVRPRHAHCGPAELVVLDSVADLESSRAAHRVGCVLLPDDRPALLINPDADAPTFRGDSPVLADLLLAEEWTPWPDAPARVDGWARVELGAQAKVEVLTGMGQLDLDPAPPQWAELVAEVGQLPVIVLLDEHVDSWLEASGWADVAKLLDRGTMLSGLIEVLPG